MSIRKPVKKISAVKQPTRPARKGARPSLGSTLGNVAAERSSSSPGKMAPGGDQAAKRDQDVTLHPEPATGEEAPRERPSATGGARRAKVVVRRRR